MKEAVHKCHAILCTDVVAVGVFMCIRHWRMVPLQLRQALLRHYSSTPRIERKPTRAFLCVAQDAIQHVFYKEHQTCSQ